MSCDIHLAVEEQIDGVWHCVWNEGIRPQVYQAEGQYDYTCYKCKRRDYRFFGLLANVRTDGPDPKGLPNDLSRPVSRLVGEWGTDGHSHSWDTLQDFCAKWKEAQKERTKFDASVNAEEKLFGIHEDEEHGPMRVVYWFNN